VKHTGTTKARAALLVVPIGLFGAGLLLGQDGDRCREVYLDSGFTAQQMTSEEFRASYSGTLCPPDCHGLQATREQMR
jgi:hypothetical protein